MIGVARERPAILGREKGVNEGVIPVNRKIAGDLSGQQSDLVQWVIIEHPSHLASLDQVGLHLGHRLHGEGGAV